MKRTPWASTVLTLAVIVFTGCASVPEVLSSHPTPPPTPSVERPDLGDANRASADDERPTYCEYTDLPEPITKVNPEYPPEARRSRMEGTVVVQALVGRDGRVKETKVVRSIPVFDRAAEASTQQWVFKPALCQGSKPVAVWVAIPVKFALP